jgi:hypothetical protein
MMCNGLMVYLSSFSRNIWITVRLYH